MVSVDVRLRRAVAADMEALERLEGRCFGERGFERDTLLILLTVQDFHTVVAEGDEGVIGYASLLMREGAPTWRLVSIAVDPLWRERGVGRLLMGHMIDLTRRGGRSTLLLEVRVTNVPAINFYLRMGFEIVNIIKGYYEDGEDALSMVLRLNDVKGYHPSRPMDRGR